MKREIEFNGVIYPLRPTMGAMVRFRNMMDKEMADMDLSNSVDVCAYLFSILKSACSADDIEFPYTFEKFCDCLTEDVMSQMLDRLIVGKANDDDSKNVKSQA